MNHKELVNRFTKACYRFEAIQEDLDILLFDTDDEIKANEYEDLADQAAEIVLKLSANGHNVGGHFYHYYLRRLEYIIDYFRELLDYEETPLAEDEQNEQDDEPTAEGRLEGFPADCAFPKKSEFPNFPDFFNKVGVLVAPTAKAEENAAPDEADTVEEDDSEDEQPEELDDENDTQTAESDEAADEEPEPLYENPGWNELPPEDHARVRETIDMWYEMNVIAGRYGEGDKRLPSAEILMRGVGFRGALVESVASGSATEILAGEIKVRRIIWEAIDDIPGFRDSEKFKKLIERNPTYNEKEQ